MLSSKLDLDNSFDLVIRKSIPFLILAPKEFRENLVELLAQFHHYYTEREETAFKAKYESICDMLETAEFDQLTGSDIHYFGYQTISMDQSIKDINRRVTKIEKWIDLFSCDTKTAGKLASIDINEGTPSIENEKSIQIENENASKAVSTKKSNVNLILEILKSSDKPVSLETIIEVTGLERSQIHKTTFHIKKKHKVITIRDGSKTSYLLEK